MIVISNTILNKPLVTLLKECLQVLTRNLR